MIGQLCARAVSLCEEYSRLTLVTAGLLFESQMAVRCSG